VARQRKAGRETASSAGRVIAGTARGIRLVAPGGGTRPIGDRVKQTLFAILEPTLRGRPFLDLYAGSGAAGIEALSRGASRAVLVDDDPRAIEAIARNLEATALSARAAVVRTTAGAWLARAASPEADQEPFAAIVVDPPYDAPAELDRTIAELEAPGPGVVLASDGVVVAKHFWRTPPSETRLLRSVRVERFGETALTFLRWAEEDG
jgi:16S rRNA (guanine966-N2)-methyltransferase